MSLVQRVETSTSAGGSSAVKKDMVRPAEVIAEKQNVSLIRRVQSEHRSPFDFATTSYRGATQPTRDAGGPKKAPADVNSHTVAISLIDEVSNIIPVLVQENDDLRSALRAVRDKAEADLEKATLIACEWRKSAESAKLRVENLEHMLAEMSERVERAEAGVATHKEIALKSSQEAAEAECLSSLFEEKVLSSFGAGSLFQTAMDRIRNRTELELG